MATLGKPLKLTYPDTREREEGGVKKREQARASAAELREQWDERLNRVLALLPVGMGGRGESQRTTAWRHPCI